MRRYVYGKEAHMLVRQLEPPYQGSDDAYNQDESYPRYLLLH